MLPASDVAMYHLHGISSFILLKCVFSAFAADVVALGDDMPVEHISRLAVLSRSEVADIVTAALNRLHNIHADIQSTKPAVGNRVVFTTVAAKDCMRFESLFHEPFTAQDDDPASLVRFYDGRQFNAFYPFRRRYEISKRFAAAPYINKVKDCFFWECLGWWPPEDRTIPLRYDDNRPKYLEPLTKPVSGSRKCWTVSCVCE